MDNKKLTEGLLKADGIDPKSVSETERKVPILGDIPFLGRLFTGSYTAKSKSELVIFISPKIVKSRS